MNTWNFPVIPALAIVSALVLAGCGHSSDSDSSTSSPAQQKYLAVARGRIDVEGGLLPLTLPVDATISDVRVHEGEQVASGQVLAVADSTDARMQSQMAQAKLEQSRQQMRDMDSRIDAANRRAQRLAAAVAAGASDGQSADDARDSARQLVQEKSAGNAVAQVAESELKMAQFLIERHTLRAPLAADVIHVAVQNGMSVSPQSAPLFVLLPRTPRIVRAELNESFLSAIHKGIPALLVNDDDAQTVIGHAHVLRLSPVFSTSAQDNDSGLQGSERTVECVLAVEGSAPLLVGQKVLVRFLTSSAETRLAP